MSSFILLRPWALLLILPLVWWWWKTRNNRSQQAWFSLLPSEIATFLGAQSKGVKKHHQSLQLLIGLLSIVALSGPSLLLEQQLQYRDESARIIILDTSYSMNASDLKPNRMQLARFKLLDLLDHWKGGETALIAVAGDAFVISPLSTDVENIKNYIPHLGPEIMPVHGSAIDLAFEKAFELISQAGLERADILLVSDAISIASRDQIMSQLPSRNVRISVLAVGTQQGAPIALGDNQQMLDQYNNVVIAKTHLQDFQVLCQATQGLCLRLKASDDDIQQLAQLPPLAASAGVLDTQSTALNYQDLGYYLLLPIFLLLALASWQGQTVLLVAILCIPSFMPRSAYANSNTWWASNDQSAAQKFEKQQFDQAAELFEDEQWQASALYRAGEFEHAKSKFELDQSAAGKYNQGNALAQLGELDAAIKSYEQALAIDPELAQAQQNLDLLKNLLQQQQEQEQQQQNSPDQSDESSDESPAQDSSNKGASPGQQQDSQTEPSSPQQAQPENDEQTQGEQEQRSSAENTPSDEQPPKGQVDSQSQQQASDDELQQWLDQLPNDPSLLLRNRMILEYQKRRQQPQSKEPW